MLRRVIYWFCSALSHWHQRHISWLDFSFVVALLIGLMTGAAAALMKTMIDFVRQLVFNNFHIHRGNFGFLILPIVGIMLAFIYWRYVVRQPMDHASDRITDDMAKGTNRLSAKLILGPIIGSSLTLGLGGSAGAEDPIAYTGAAIGSNVGKAFNLDADQLAMLVGCGAAAGIAGIFMAPIGGVMFALEVLKMKQDLKSILVIVVASLTSALTCYILLGCHTDVTFMPSMRFENSLIPMVLLCGILCGMYSAYYSVMMAVCRRWFQHIGNLWWRALAGGVIVAGCLFLFPSLYGEGYDTVGKLMDDDPLFVVSYGPLYHWGLDFTVLLVLMVVLLLLKPLATSATNDSGGVGGDFTPTLFCGAILGFFFAGVCNHFFHMHLSYALFAFFGMSAVMSGAIRAPLMAIFITAEMTGLYGFILPLTLAALASFLTTFGITSIKTPLPFLHRFHSKSETPPANKSSEST